MNATQQAPNDVDQMLSGFFKSEMPDPFPPFRNARPLAASRNAREYSRSASNKSRFALAASVAILLGGCWYLSGQMGTSNQLPGAVKGEGGSAKLTKEHEKAIKDMDKTPMMP